jgi:hypothetical protein
MNVSLSELYDIISEEIKKISEHSEEATDSDGDGVSDKEEVRSAWTFAPTAAEEAQKLNDQTGLSYNTDQSYWEELGVATGEDLARSVLSQAYSDMYKSKEGIRPRWVRFDDMSIEDIQAMIDELDADEAEGGDEDEGWFSDIEDERQDQMQADAGIAQQAHDEIKAEKERMMTPEQGEEFEKQSGMRRRLRESLDVHAKNRWQHLAGIKDHE